MILRNDTGRVHFVPTITAVGSTFQIGQIKTVPDILRWDPVVNGEIVAGRLAVLGFDPDSSSVVIHDEVGAGGGAGGAHVIQIQENAHSTGNTIFVTATSIVLDFSKISALPALLYWSQERVPGGGDSAEVRLWNSTDSLALATVTGITTLGLKSVTLGALPVGTKLIQLQHRVTGGAQSAIDGGSLHLGL